MTRQSRLCYNKCPTILGGHIAQTPEERKQKKKESYLKNRDRWLARQKEVQRERMKDPVWRADYCERLRRYGREHYEARLLSTIKSKCKSGGIPFDLEIDDIVIPTHCPKTGIPLVIHTERGKFYDTPSVDRIDPKGGYVKQNIQIVSLWYNVAKLNWPEEVFVEMCKKVVELNG